MKRVVTFCLVAMMVFMLTGCGKSEQSGGNQMVTLSITNAAGIADRLYVGLRETPESEEYVITFCKDNDFAVTLMCPAGKYSITSEQWVKGTPLTLGINEIKVTSESKEILLELKEGAFEPGKANSGISSTVIIIVGAVVLIVGIIIVAVIKAKGKKEEFDESQLENWTK